MRCTWWQASEAMHSRKVAKGSVDPTGRRSCLWKNPTDGSRSTAQAHGEVAIGQGRDNRDGNDFCPCRCERPLKGQATTPRNSAWTHSAASDYKDLNANSEEFWCCRGDGFYRILSGGWWGKNRTLMLDRFQRVIFLLHLVVVIWPNSVPYSRNPRWWYLQGVLYCSKKVVGLSQLETT